MDKSNYVVVHEALKKLHVQLKTLFRRARAKRQPGMNSLVTEQLADRDYEQYKETHTFPDYLLEFSLDAMGYKLLVPQKPFDNVRNFEARRTGVVDLNALKKPKK